MTNAKFIRVNRISALKDFGMTDISVAIGVFDGVHLGHRSLIAHLVRQSELMETKPVVLTFSPHPREVLDPEHAPRLLLPPDRKAELLTDAGARAVVTIPFTRELAARTAEEFLESCLLSEGVRVRGFSVGRRFRCGAGGHGSTEILSACAAASGVRFETVPELKIDGETVSSSAIREALETGDMDKARRFLGRRPALYGEIESGNGIAGTELEHPTANLHVRFGVIPPPGVYAAFAGIDGVFRPSAVNIGFSPTFSDHGPLRVEVHLMNFSGCLYGMPMELELIGRVREERKFPSVEALKAQIPLDIAAIRTLIEKERN